MRPHAILFDLDDTILIEDTASQRAWHEICGKYAVKTRLCNGDELRQRIRDSSEWFWGDHVRAKNAVASFFGARVMYVRHALQGLGCDDVEIARHIVADFTALKDTLIGFYPNAEDTVKELAQKGIKLALLTNGEAKTQRDKAERFGLTAHFPVCLIEGELGYGKPDPRVFKLALERLNVPAEKAWMVGDNLEWDIKGAQKQGIFSVWCDYARSGLPANTPAQPDSTIHDISELLKLIDKEY